MFAAADIPHFDFNSCMREDCNRSTGILTVGIRYFDSCMREDCNVTELPGGSWTAYFNSYMREDCNRFTGILTEGIRYFNSCMREDCNDRFVWRTCFSIHVCARIATPQATPLRPDDFNSCMCEDCNSCSMHLIVVLCLFQFMHA